MNEIRNLEVSKRNLERLYQQIEDLQAQARAWEKAIAEYEMPECTCNGTEVMACAYCRSHLSEQEIPY